MILKIAGLLLIFLTSAAIGLFKTLSLHQRVKQLESLQGSILHISEEIRYSATPIKALMADLDEIDEYKSLKIYGICSRELQTVRDFNVAWDHTIVKVNNQLNLEKKDFELLSVFGRGLGTTDSEGQIINCERHARLIGENIESAKKDAEVKGKLYSALGVIVGIFLVILFL